MLRRMTSRTPVVLPTITTIPQVRFSDTDAQGIVYYGRYMPYFDLARVEYLRHLGLLRSDLGPRQFVMRAFAVEYDAPAVFDDLIEVFVRLARFGRTSATYEYAAHRFPDGELMVTATQTVVLIDPATRRPLPVTDELRAPVRAFEGDALLGPVLKRLPEAT